MRARAATLSRSITSHVPNDANLRDRATTDDGAVDRQSVVHLVDALEVGGLERVVASIVSGLDRSRYDVRVLCLVTLGPIAEELREAGISVDCFAYDRGRRVKEIFRLRRWLCRHHASILHTHGYSAGVVGRVAGILAGVPVLVAHLHTTDWGYRFRQRVVEWTLSHWTDRVVCCSEAVACFARQTCGIPFAKLSVIYNGVPVEQLSERGAAARDTARQRWGLPHDGIVIGVVGSLTTHKGQEIAIDAIARLRQRIPALRLLIIGDGQERPRLESHVQQLGLESIVVFTGVQRDISPLLTASDLVCLPSVRREGLGLALLEAMACGTPVVASKLDGIAEVVIDGRSGLLVPPRDPAALADALEQLLGDREHCRAVGEYGRQRVRRNFHAQLMVQRMTELYDTLSSHCGPRDGKRVPIFYTTCRQTLEGGGQQSLLQLLAHLDRQRFQPIVLCPERGPLSEALEAAGIETIAVTLPRVRVTSLHLVLPAIVKLLRLIRMRGVKLVHCDAPRETFYAGVAARLCRIPLVWHVRASQGDWLDRWLVLLSSRLVLVATALRERFRLAIHHSWLSGKLTVVHNGVELPSSGLTTAERQKMKQQIGAGSRTIIILVVGRVEPLKGAHVLLEALTRLQHGPSYRLLFIGAADAGYQRRLEQQSAESGIAGRIHYLGHRDDVMRWIELADILLHPSLFEAFPRVILEGMAASKPVIATRVGGVVEGVVHDETGILVPSGDSRALAAAIERLLGDVDLRRAMGKAGKDRVRAHFGAETHARRIEAVYDSLLGVR